MAGSLPVRLGQASLAAMSSFRFVTATETSPASTNRIFSKAAAQASMCSLSPVELFQEEESLRSATERSSLESTSMDLKQSNRTSYSLAPSGDETTSGQEDASSRVVRFPYSASNISEDSVGTFGHRRRPQAVYPPVTQANLTLLNSLATPSAVSPGICGTKTKNGNGELLHQSMTNKSGEQQENSSVEDVQMPCGSQDSSISTPLLGSRSTLSSAPTLLTIPSDQPPLSTTPSTNPPSPQESGLAKRRYQKTPAPLHLGNHGSSQEMVKAPFASGLVSVYPSAAAAAPAKPLTPCLRRSRRVPLTSYLPEPDPQPRSGRSIGRKADHDMQRSDSRTDPILYIEYGPEIARARAENPTQDVFGSTTTTANAIASQDREQRHNVHHNRILSDPIGAMVVNEFYPGPSPTADQPPHSPRPSLRPESITSTAAQGGCRNLHQQSASPRLWPKMQQPSSPSVPVEAAPLSRHTSLLIAARTSLQKSRAGFQRSRSPEIAATPERDQTLDSALEQMLSTSSRDFVAGRSRPSFDVSRPQYHHSQSASVPGLDLRYCPNPLEGSTGAGEDGHVGKAPARSTSNNDQSKDRASHWLDRLKNSFRRTGNKTVTRKASRNVTDFVDVLPYNQHP